MMAEVKGESKGDYTCNPAPRQSTPELNKTGELWDGKVEKWGLMTIYFHNGTFPRKTSVPSFFSTFLPEEPVCCGIERK